MLKIIKEFSLDCLAIAAIFMLMLLAITWAKYNSNRMERSGIIEIYTAEVSLEKVPVRGEAVFEARVEIKYKDGKIESVTLVPGSTVKK